MRWADAHRIAMGAAFEAQEDLELDTADRVDVFSAIAGAGLKLAFRPLDSAGLYLPAAVAGRPGVLVNGQQPLAMQRYTAAHEYGHHVFGHGEQIDLHGEPRGTRATLPPHEMIAEAFAAWFLMPPEAVIASLRRVGIEAAATAATAATAAQAYQLSLRLGASFRATCNHVRGLGRWRDIVPKTLKLGLTTNAPPGGWHHDVWSLTDRDVDAAVVARCGDALLLLQLPGWDVEAAPPGARAELQPSLDILTAPYWRVDLPSELPAGPCALVLRRRAQTLTFDLVLERPRHGRYAAAAKGARR